MINRWAPPRVDSRDSVTCSSPPDATSMRIPSSAASRASSVGLLAGAYGTRPVLFSNSETSTR